MTNQELAKAIEALLFAANEPQKIKRLAALFEVSEEEIKTAVAGLEEVLKERGIRLVSKDDEVFLGSAPEFSAFAEKFFKQEIESELTKTSLETLAIVAYQGPISRSKIEHIRGVNSLYTLRNLMIRGLVERIQDAKDQRSYLYRISFDLMKLLGITKREELPNFTAASEEMNKFLAE
ncbi:MAG: SMC-Scp complex subunit ScpB [Candidatus Niyogibacteria bacterium RIFCSPLOWO2_12_FULL_41_13]|uniref:SMC-Scp complex subunit ScpB n=1 Tax=Candidatus Niyogibacteria bacterium RIFCSPLOWO2_12_FULL_41_13 TaxID=1801726 RepID=A0A1G2F4R6_9BACT|nr:MAG: SMC-Scp complex subunit ScpB [Candidatus Niyogibacteria bacterium RIFCSPLOWO2_12_FULL_41_13]